MESNHRFAFSIADRVALSEAAPLATVVNRFFGGFGEVYVLQDENAPLGLYAAKTPSRDLGLSQDVLDQFAREAVIWSKLPPHANVLPSYGIRRHNDWPFILMKYVHSDNPAGASLAAILESDRHGMLKAGCFSTIALIGGQLIHVLADLEQADPAFIHGDLKPANILVENVLASSTEFKEKPFMRLMLSDFGLSRSHAARDIGRPLDGGSYRYLAPECLDGVYGHKAQDIYALGCTLFELTMGMCYQIHDSATDVLALNQGGASVEQMARARPDVPKAILEIVFQCLRQNPCDRPDSFATLALRWESAITKAGGNVVLVTGKDNGEPGWLNEVDQDPLTRYLVDQLGLATGISIWVMRAITEANRLSNLRQFDQSKALLMQVLDVVPGFAPAIAARAYGLSLQQETYPAIVGYTSAIQTYVTTPLLLDADQLGFGAACATLAQLLVSGPSVSDDDCVQASRLARVATQYIPNSAKAYMAEGMALLRLHDTGAEKALARAFELDPANRRIRMYLGVARMAGSSVDAETERQVQQELQLSNTEMQTVRGMLGSF